MTMTVAGRTHPGRVRRENQDAVCWDTALGLMLVADGMGGHNAGEVAARLAVDAIRSFLEQSASPPDIAWPFGVDPALSSDGNRLSTALRLANHRVVRAGEQQPGWAGMGTTVVAALVRGYTLTYVGVGDSRLYRWRAGTLDQLTIDDSWIVALQAQDPGVSRGALAAHPMRHVLTNVIGGRDPLEVHVRDTAVAAGDRLLLATDGLHGLVDDGDVSRLLGTGASADAIAQALIDLALAHGGSDNVSVVVGLVD